MKPGNFIARRKAAAAAPRKTTHDWKKRQAEIKAELDRIDREIALHYPTPPPTPEHLRD